MGRLVLVVVLAHLLLAPVVVKGLSVGRVSELMAHVELLMVQTLVLLRGRQVVVHQLAVLSSVAVPVNLGTLLVLVFVGFLDRALWQNSRALVLWERLLRWSFPNFWSLVASIIRLFFLDRLLGQVVVRLKSSTCAILLVHHRTHHRG